MRDILLVEQVNQFLSDFMDYKPWNAGVMQYWAADKMVPSLFQEDALYSPKVQHCRLMS